MKFVFSFQFLTAVLVAGNLISTAGFAAIDGSITAEQTPSQKSLSLSVGLNSQTISSDITSGTVAGAEAGANWKHNLMPELSMNVAADFFLETGAMRARYTDEFAPRQVARLREASVSYQPTPALRFTAGAQDQTIWKSRLLFREQSFPAAIESGVWKSGNWTFGLKLEQAIAADTSTRQPWGNWPQGSPSFFIEQARAQFDFGLEDFVGLRVSHFLYQNLSAPTAYSAQFLGNSVAGSAAADARFLYRYQGYQAALDGSFSPLAAWKFGWELEGAYNPAAPAGKKLGVRARLTPSYRVSSDLSIQAPLEFFSVEPDAVLSFYQPRQFGHTNRTGFLVGVEATVKDPSLKIAAEWIESRPIFSHGWQTPMTWLQVSLKTDYVVF